MNECPPTSAEDKLVAKPCQRLTSEKDEGTPGHVLGEEVPTCRTERPQLKRRPGEPMAGQAPSQAHLSA